MTTRLNKYYYYYNCIKNTPFTIIIITCDYY